MPFRTAFDNRVRRLFHYQPYRRAYLENTLYRGVVRFARASEFNDPWDCRPLFYVPTDREAIDDLVRFMHRSSQRHDPDTNEETRLALSERFRQYPDELRRALEANAADMWTMLDRIYRLYCLTTKPDCPLMWGHYADHHRGVCLEFNAMALDIASAIQVEYHDQYPCFSLSDDTDLSSLHSKSSDWSYEQEYRLVAQEENAAVGPGTLMTRDGMYQLSQGTLVAIIIGCCASADVAAEVERMGATTGLVIRRAMRLPDRYGLVIAPPIAD